MRGRTYTIVIIVKGLVTRRGIRAIDSNEGGATGHAAYLCLFHICASPPPPQVGLPAPDLLLYMSISPEVSEQRGEFGEEVYEKLGFQSKVGTMGGTGEG